MMIANRILKFRRAGEDVDIPIRVFAPEQQDGNWICRYEIEWPHGTWRSAAGGMDSMQALLLAGQKIGTEVYTSEYHKEGGLMWHAPSQGYGFPVPNNLRDFLVGDDRTFL